MSSQVREVAIEAANAARKVVEAYIEKGFRIDLKGPNNIVTEADIACEKEIIKVIKQTFPDHSFLGEEEAKAEITAEHLWVIDPIDGTNNFAHSIPHVGISIAYANQGDVEYGIVLNPYTGEAFTAEKDKGAFLNDKRISCTQVATIGEAMVATGFYYDYGPDVAQGIKAIEILIKEECHGVRRLGAASLDLCYVACGRFDAYYELRLNSWDFAAGMLIVREAGGQVLNLEGSPLNLRDTRLIACNKKLMGEMMRVVHQAGQGES